MLTEEQRKLIEQNLPYCYKYFHEHHIYGEDRQQSLLERLCRYIHLYDVDRGSITTFIKTVFESNFKILERDEHRMIRYGDNIALHLSDPLYTDNDGAEVTIADTLESLEDGIEDIENKILIDNIYRNLKLDKKLNDRNIEIFFACLDTGNMAFVARLYNLSRERVRVIYKKVITLIAEHHLYDNTIDSKYSK